MKKKETVIRKCSKVFAKVFNTHSKHFHFLNENPKYSKYSIGDYSYGDFYRELSVSWFENQANLKIGKFCSIASGVRILLGGEHRIDWVTTYPFSRIFAEFQHFQGNPTTKGDVIIGNDVWIGENAVILSGVSIGDGAVIGAYSVVTKDVMPYSIVAGNPAKLIRMRFDKETVDSLLRIKWWDWDFAQIRDNMPLLLSNNLRELIDRNDSKIQQ